MFIGCVWMGRMEEDGVMVEVRLGIVTKKI